MHNKKINPPPGALQLYFEPFLALILKSSSSGDYPLEVLDQIIIIIRLVVNPTNFVDAGNKLTRPYYSNGAQALF